MKTTSIITRQITTSTLTEIDLVRQGWQIQYTTTDGKVIATKQKVVEMSHPESAAGNMTTYNLSADTPSGELIVAKIDFGPGKVGLIWNTKKRLAEAWLNKPVD